MKYYSSVDDTVYHITTIRRMHRDISIPDGSDLSDLGYYRVVKTPVPQHDGNTQSIVFDRYDIVGSEAHEILSVVGKSQSELELEREKKREGLVVSKRQAKQRLLLSGLLDSVQQAINSIEDPTSREMMKIYWEDSQEFERTHPQLVALATDVLGLSSGEIDDLFESAREL